MDWQKVLLVAAVMYSIVLHEFGHAITAHWFGDPTPKADGRITLNPIPSISLVGSIVVPLVFVFLVPGGLMFGWANPVKVVPSNFRPKVAGDLAVSMAGIVINFLIAVLCMVAYILEAVPRSESFWYQVAFYNVLLAVFNLVPIPPLDGHHVFKYLLPGKLRVYYQGIGFFGVVILIAAIAWVPQFQGFLLEQVQFGVSLAYSAGEALVGLFR